MTFPSLDPIVFGMIFILLKIPIELPEMCRMLTRRLSPGLWTYHALFLVLTLLPLQPGLFGKFPIIHQDSTQISHPFWILTWLPGNTLHTISLYSHTTWCTHSYTNIQHGLIAGLFTSWSPIWDCKLFKDENDSFEWLTWLSRVRHCRRARHLSYLTLSCGSWAAS